MNSIRKKMLSMVLSLSVSAGMLSAGPAVFADTTYNVWVAGVQVTSANMDDVLNDGGKVRYEPGEQTLIFDEPFLFGSHNDAIIYSDETLQIEGEASFSDDSVTYGIYVDGTLHINGDVSSTAKSYGVYVTDSVYINGNVNAAGSQAGIFAEISDIIINDGSVNATGERYGIAATGEYHGGPGGYINVKKGILNAIATGEEGVGIYATGSFSIRNDVTKVHAEGPVSAIFLEGLDVAPSNSIGEDLSILIPEGGQLCSDEEGGVNVYVMDGSDIATSALIANNGAVHNVTAGETEHGTITFSASENVFEGELVTVTAHPDELYEQTAFWVEDADGNTVETRSDNTFIMPASDVTVYIEFTLWSGDPDAPVPGDPTDTPTEAPTAAPTAAPDSSSETGVAGFVERLYTIALGRTSDPAGKQSWIDAITLRGTTGAEAARGFLYSPEFLNKDLSNGDFTVILYATFFNRMPDEAGYNAWVAALDNGASKQEVIEGFINSTEWANLCLSYGIASGGTGTPNVEVEPSQGTIDFCTRLYTTCLNRAADENGLMAWARQLANQRDTGTGAARGFFFSSEFTNQNVNNGEYVTRLYRTFMGREPDEAGYNAWVGQLDSGVSREEVFNGFAQSPEFTQICASYGIMR